jgi:hypothetical protein
MAKGAAPNEALAQARERALSNVADQLAAALERDRIKAGRRYTDYRDLSKRMGRDMNRTVPNILKEGDTTISTLADLAHVTGSRLEIRFVDRDAVTVRMPGPAKMVMR